MNCSSLELSNTKLGWRAERVSRDEAGRLQCIRQLLQKRAIDLGELRKAISAVPRLAFRLCQMMNDSGVECANVSDAAVLAGRAGIESLLDECSRPTSSHTKPKPQTSRLVKL